MKEDNRTLEELEKAYLSSESVEEFDRILHKAESCRRRYIALGASVCVAASLVLVLILWQGRSTCNFSGIEIAESIQQIMDIDAGNLKSVTAKPDGRRIILKAEMNDGSTYFYVMDRDGGSESISITAMK